MDLSKELKFNLYNILVIPLEETIDEISYLYKGKLNEPNVMVIENGDMTPFVCEKLIVKKTQKQIEQELENLEKSILHQAFSRKLP